MIANVQCSHCGEAFEQNIEGKTSLCPHCGQETLNYSPRPKTERLPEPEKESESSKILNDPIRNKIKDLREWANNVALVGIACALIGLLAGLITVCMVTGANSEGESSKAAVIGFPVMGGFLAAAFWIYMIAQIIHIRANTLKDNW
jgi:DNA-directed RNA polymerase subunit RPC12/RpoP